MQGNEVSLGAYHSSDVNPLSFSKSKTKLHSPQRGWETSYHIYLHFLCWAFLPLRILGIRRLKQCWPYWPYWRNKHSHIFPTKIQYLQKKIGLGSKVQLRNSTRRKSAGGDSEIWATLMLQICMWKAGASHTAMLDCAGPIIHNEYKRHGGGCCNGTCTSRRFQIDTVLFRIMVTSAILQVSGYSTFIFVCDAYRSRFWPLTFWNTKTAKPLDRMKRVWGGKPSSQQSIHTATPSSCWTCTTVAAARHCT